LADKNKKNKTGVIYSTNPDFDYKFEGGEEATTLEARSQDLRVMLDKKSRAGKVVTLVTGFVGKDDDLKDLAKILKTKCGVGGSSKDGEIVIQGDFKEKIYTILLQLNYKVKKAG